MRSISDFTTRRLSFRLRLDGRCSSKLETPMVIGMNGLPSDGARPAPLPLPIVGDAGVRGLLQNGRHLFAGIRLDEVARLEVLELFQPNTAVEAGPDLRGVVLEPAQRGDLPFVDDA